MIALTRGSRRNHGPLPLASGCLAAQTLVRLGPFGSACLLDGLHKVDVGGTLDVFIFNQQAVYIDHFAAIGVQIIGRTVEGGLGIFVRVDQHIVGGAQEAQLTPFGALVGAVASDGAQDVDDLRFERGGDLGVEVPRLGVRAFGEILCGQRCGQDGECCDELFHIRSPQFFGLGMAKPGTTPLVMPRSSTTSSTTR